jgi:hypothetical protein
MKKFSKGIENFNILGNNQIKSNFQGDFLEKNKNTFSMSSKHKLENTHRTNKNTNINELSNPPKEDLNKEKKVNSNFHFKFRYYIYS